MKILTQEEKDANYRETLKGGVLGGILGVTLGSAGVILASRRFPAFRNVTIQFRAFIAVSAGTFSSIVLADRFSSNYEIHRNKARAALAAHVSDYDRYEAQKPWPQRARHWATEHRYSIVMAVWVTSMGGSLYIVSRNPYLTATQKFVQARMYAQGLTLAALLGSFAFETRDASLGRGRWETVKVLDPNDPLHERLIEKRIHHELYLGEDQWISVINAEEQRMKERDAQRDMEKKSIRDSQERAETEHKKPK